MRQQQRGGESVNSSSWPQWKCCFPRLVCVTRTHWEWSWELFLTHPLLSAHPSLSPSREGEQEVRECQQQQLLHSLRKCCCCILSCKDKPASRHDIGGRQQQCSKWFFCVRPFCVFCSCPVSGVCCCLSKFFPQQTTCTKVLLSAILQADSSDVLVCNCRVCRLVNYIYTSYISASGHMTVSKNIPQQILSFYVQCQKWSPQLKNDLLWRKAHVCWCLLPLCKPSQNTGEVVHRQLPEVKVGEYGALSGVWFWTLNKFSQKMKTSEKILWQAN